MLWIIWSCDKAHNDDSADAGAGSLHSLFFLHGHIYIFVDECIRSTFVSFLFQESHNHTGRDRHLWGYNTLEEIQRLGQQTYQRALRNHAAWTAYQGQPTLDPVHSKKSQQRTAACPICGVILIYFFLLILAYNV